MPRNESDDGLLRLWECPHILGGHNPDFERCGFIARGDKGEPGFCPYDHGERVQLIPLIATVLCSDCGIPIERDDCRADDDRLVCGNCVMAYIPRTAACHMPTLVCECGEDGSARDHHYVILARRSAPSEERP